MRTKYALVITAMVGALLTAPDRCDPALAAENSAILARLNG